MKKNPIFYALLAALLYALATPASKIILKNISPFSLAGLLYLGAGLGSLFILLLKKVHKQDTKEESLKREDFKLILWMIALDTAAPVFLMTGLKAAAPENVSLLNNFEIVATSVIARLFFKEKISKSLTISIVLITVASIILSLNGSYEGLHFSSGSWFVLAACICWGFENNCTRSLSDKNPIEIVIIKGFGSGSASILIGICIGEKIPFSCMLPVSLLIGFMSIGLSVLFYIKAQRFLGAAKTSSYYAASPFIGAIISIIVFFELPHYTFFIASALMIAGVFISTKE